MTEGSRILNYTPLTPLKTLLRLQKALPIAGSGVTRGAALLRSETCTRNFAGHERHAKRKGLEPFLWTWRQM